MLANLLFFYAWGWFVSLFPPQLLAWLYDKPVSFSSLSLLGIVEEFIIVKLTRTLSGSFGLFTVIQ